MRYTEVLQHGEEIKKLRSDGMKWKDIAKIYDCRYQYLQLAVMDERERSKRNSFFVKKSFMNGRKKNKDVANAVRAERKKRGMTIKQLSVLCDVTYQTIVYWESGYVRANENVLKKAFGEDFKIERADETDLPLP